MGKEIERKFLVDKSVFSTLIDYDYASIVQGYIYSTKNESVRIRTHCKNEDKAYITLKKNSSGFSRHEYEYEIPIKDALEMFEIFCEKVLVKHRYVYFHAGFLWEIDIFLGDNDGLIVAEIELDSEDQYFEKPDWVMDEVTHDPKYISANLIDNPYKQW